MEDGAFLSCEIFVLWYLWSESNDRSFEDCGMTLNELKSFFFNTLYLWTIDFVSPLVLCFIISLFFSLSS